MVLLPNEVPDLVELKTLQAVLEDTTLEMSGQGGVSHELVWGYYQDNLAQAQADWPSVPDYVQWLVAAYMTLGTEGHKAIMPYFLREFYGETRETQGQTTSFERYFLN